MWGKETTTWIGKRVVLWAAPYFDRTTKEHTTCIRVRGSPDIAGPVNVTIKLPRKKPEAVHLAKTNGKMSAEAAPPAARKLVIDEPPPISEEEAASIIANENAATVDTPF